MLRQPPPYTQDEQLMLWKWQGSSHLSWSGRYARYGEPEYQRDEDEQDRIGHCLVTPNGGYSLLVGEGRTEEDCIANAIWNTTFDGLGLIHVSQGKERWVERRYYTEGQAQRVRMTLGAAYILVRETLVRDGMGFIDFPI